MDRHLYIYGAFFGILFASLDLVREIFSQHRDKLILIDVHPGDLVSLGAGQHLKRTILVIIQKRLNRCFCLLLFRLAT